jgi:hypothetical protein
MHTWALENDIRSVKEKKKMVKCFEIICVYPVTTDYALFLFAHNSST